MLVYVKIGAGVGGFDGRRGRRDFGRLIEVRWLLILNKSEF